MEIYINAKQKHFFSSGALNLSVYALYEITMLYFKQNSKNESKLVKNDRDMVLKNEIKNEINGNVYL